LQPDVDEAVFSATPGEVVGPIRTIYGHSVLQVLSVEPPRQIDFDRVRDAVSSRLLSQRREAGLADFEVRLQTAATVEWGLSFAER